MAVFPQFLQGYQAGEAIADKRRRSQALLGSGAALARGDYTGAATPLLEGGYLPEAAQVQQYGKTQQDRALERTVGGQMSSGDLPGAEKAAYGAGNIDMGVKIHGLGSSITKEQREHAAQMFDEHAQIALALKPIALGARKTRALQMIQGTPYDTPEMRQALESADYSDQGLDSYITMSKSAAAQLLQHDTFDEKKREFNAGLALKAGGGAAPPKLPTGFNLDPAPEQ